MGIAVAATVVLFAVWWTTFWPPLGSIAPPTNAEGSGYILPKLVLGLALAVLLWEGRGYLPGAPGATDEARVIPPRPGRPAGAGLPRGEGSRVKGYLSIRPVGARSAVRLYSCFLLAGISRTLRPGRFRGPYLYGTSPAVIASGGLRFEIRPRSEDLHYTLPDHKPAVRRHFAPRAGETVVEVGAHVGFYAIRAGACGARVLAIEPNPATARQLRTNARLNGLHDFEVLNVALADREGTGTLYVPRLRDGRASLIRGAAADGADPGLAEVAVTVETLDRVVLPRGETTVDWLLIDTEGAEVAVLTGGPRTLERTTHLLLEVSEGTSEACRRLLDARGFEIVSEERQTRFTSYLVARRPPVRDR